ncbi:unnamed protein product [Heligmosomoides polygyrus]|uniref:Carboxymuconolactone decarboxylase family protein n=1 Tax=Heligmosomoides polygyrus TaxID=6339 RepID=A0A183G7M8_HELPZ|nr:unnamed protein product [Heligmosomoides polygyrus]
MSDFYKALDKLELNDPKNPLVQALRGFGSKIESLFNIAANMGARLDSMEPALSQLAKFNPKSTCVFCNVEAQKDGKALADVQITARPLPGPSRPPSWASVAAA